MGIPLVYGRTFGDWARGISATNGLILSGCIAVGLIVFAVAAYVLKCKEMHSLLSLLRDLDHMRLSEDPLIRHPG